MTNAEIANQAKAASASVDQIYAIKEVLEAHGMENLPRRCRSSYACA